MRHTRLHKAVFTLHMAYKGSDIRFVRSVSGISELAAKYLLGSQLQQHAKHNNILYFSHHDNKINQTSFSKTYISFQSQYQYFSLSHLACVFETLMKKK
jgi:hypothetical protein